MDSYHSCMLLCWFSVMEFLVELFVELPTSVFDDLETKPSINITPQHLTAVSNTCEVDCGVVWCGVEWSVMLRGVECGVEWSVVWSGVE